MSEGVTAALIGAIAALVGAVLTAFLQPWIKEKFKGGLDVRVTHEHFGMPAPIIAEINEHKPSEHLAHLLNAKGRTKITIENQSSSAIEGVTVRVRDVGPVLAEFLDGGEKVATQSGNTFRLGALYPSSHFSLEVYTQTCFAALSYDEAVEMIAVTAKAVGKINMEEVLWGHLRDEFKLVKKEDPWWKFTFDARVVIGLFFFSVILARLFEATFGIPVSVALGIYEASPK